jgi:uncharacterized protein (TIGR04562 family)
MFEIPWGVLDLIISGKSSIDSPVGFQINSFEEATRFLDSYGYDLNNPIESAEILGIFHESLNFIRKNFLAPENPEGVRLELPRRILEITDVRNLFLMANLNFPGQQDDSQGQYLKNWACAILKIMHTIAHIDKDLRSPYFADIQKQIFDRFYKLVHRTSEGVLYLGEKEDDPNRIDLVLFETKPKKARNSIILKLLHKPENVAEELFDRVGLRFITKTRYDALKVIRYLKERMVIMPPNIKPSRSRNTLIDVEIFKGAQDLLLQKLDRAEIDQQVIGAKMDEAAASPLVDPSNPHSSEFYRAIQFTCRQLIKLKNPLFDHVKELKSVAKGRGVEDDLTKAIDRIDLKYIQREVRFFYPYEVQVMDEKSAIENEQGQSAHHEYKKAQLQTALRRVMGSLVHGQR